MKSPSLLPALALGLFVLPALGAPGVAPPQRGTINQALAQSTSTDAATGVQRTVGLNLVKDLRPDIGGATTITISESYMGPNGSGQRMANCPVAPTQYRSGGGSAELAPTTLDFSQCQRFGERYGENAGPWLHEGTIVVSARWGQPLDVEQGTSQAQRTVRGSAPGGWRETCNYFRGQAAQGSATIGDLSFSLSWDWGTPENNQYSSFEYRNCTWQAL